MSGDSTKDCGWIDPFSEWLWQTPVDLDEADGPRLVPSTLACPDWCTEVEGHGFEPRPTGWLRVHRRRFGDRPTHVALETFERAAQPEGPSDLGLDPGATLVRVQFPHASGYLTAAGARRLAERLTEAATVAESEQGEPQ